jgi:hypothetical protein
MAKRRRSALEAYDGCPYRYDQLYNQGVEDRGDESQRGIAFHEIAFRYIDRLAKAQVPSDAEEAALAFQEGIALSQLPAHLVHEVAKLWRRFAEWFQLDLQAYLSAEEQQESERFTWIPDLVYVRPQGIEIKDWKTYYKGLTELQARREFQLKFYLVQALDIWPNFPAYTFTFNFVRIGYEVAVTFTPDEIEDFRPEVEAILLLLEEAERTQNWPAIPGSHCTLCRLACPIVDNPARLPVRLNTKAEAMQAAGEIMALTQRRKVLTKALAGWCNQEGPIVVKGQEFAHRSSTSKTYPALDVLDLLGARYDEAGLRRLLVSATAVTKADPLKLLKGDDDLAALAKTTTRWRFSDKKAGAIGDADQNDDDDDNDE